MFESYLQLYQLIFIFLQIGSLYLVANLNLNYSLRLLVLTYFRVYCSYSCSKLSMLATLIIYVMLLTSYLPKTIQKWAEMDDKNEAVKLKTLTLITVIANIAFFPLSHLLLERYLNDFSLNIGYIFLFFGFPWAFNSVYFSELVINRIEIVNENLPVQTESKPQK